MQQTYKGLTREDFHRKFEYSNGKLYHKSGRFAGKEAGSAIESNGGYRYVCLSVSGKPVSVLAHRIIWFMVMGEVLPDDMVIDHIDGNPDNNKIENLRAVTYKENSRNRGRRPKRVGDRYVLTSVLGVKFDKQEMCYVACTGDGEILRTLDFDDAKYARWGWEYDNGFTDRY